MEPRAAIALALLLAAAQQLPGARAAAATIPVVADLLSGLGTGLAGAIAPGQPAGAAAASAASASAAPAPNGMAGFPLLGGAGGLPLPLPLNLGGATGGSAGAGGLAPALKAAFSLACPVLPISVPPFPIKSDRLCDSTGMNVANNQLACMIFEVMGSMMTNPPLRCAPEAVKAPGAVDAQGRPVPQPLPDRRARGRLPASLPAARVLEEEGGTLGWLYKQVQRVYMQAHCGALGKDAPLGAPAGWDLVKTVDIHSDLQSYGLNATSVPMVALLKQGAAARAASAPDCAVWAAKAARGGARAAAAEAADLCGGGHLLVVIRGTGSSHEWAIDFDYNMEKDANYGPGLLHRGFLATANQVWDGGLRQLLDDEVAAGGGAVKHVTFAGHSLGAALATLLSVRAQKYLAQASKTQAAWKSWPSKAPTVSAALFGAPNVGDAAFAAHFDSNINARNIRFEYDIIPQMPCAPITTACSNAKTPTPNANGAWPYSSVGGAVHLTHADMAAQPRAWRAFAQYRQSDMCAAPESLMWASKAVHWCSYSCALSQFIEDDADTQCLLWPATGKEAQAGSFCLHGFEAAFPHTEPALFPSP